MQDDDVATLTPDADVGQESSVYEGTDENQFSGDGADTPQQHMDWQKRALDNQSAFTRVSQEAAELRRKHESIAPVVDVLQNLTPEKLQQIDAIIQQENYVAPEVRGLMSAVAMQQQVLLEGINKEIKTFFDDFKDKNKDILKSQNEVNKLVEHGISMFGDIKNMQDLRSVPTRLKAAFNDLYIDQIVARGKKETVENIRGSNAKAPSPTSNTKDGLLKAGGKPKFKSVKEAADWTKKNSGII